MGNFVILLWLRNRHCPYSAMVVKQIEADYLTGYLQCGRFFNTTFVSPRKIILISIENIIFVDKMLFLFNANAPAIA